MLWSNDKTTYGTVNKQIPVEILNRFSVRRKSNEIVNFCKPTICFVFFCIFYVFYMIVGASLFSYFETPKEKAIISKFLESKLQFLKEYPTVKAKDLEKLINEVVEASSLGVAVNNETSYSNWEFGQSLFFTSTVLTTIGYGRATPLTKEGQIFCICYATVGIPLTLVLISALVSRLKIPSNWFLKLLHKYLQNFFRLLNIRLIHFLIIITILIGIFMLLPASIFEMLEPEWDYFDSLYYCFISLTTIGLGDYIPGDTPGQPYRQLYKIGIAAYLIIGTTFMMFTLSLFNDIRQLNLGLLFKSEEQKILERRYFFEDILIESSNNQKRDNV